MQNKTYLDLVVAGATPAVVELFQRLTDTAFELVGQKALDYAKLTGKTIDRAMADLIFDGGFPRTVETPTTLN